VLFRAQDNHRGRRGRCDYDELPARSQKTAQACSALHGLYESKRRRHPCRLPVGPQCHPYSHARSAAFRQAGITQTKTLEEFIDVCAIFASQPPPKGNHVGIVTNSGGPGVLAVDACARAGLSTPQFPASLVHDFQAILPPVCPTSNPVDLGPEGSPDVYHQVTELLLTEPSIDMGLILCVPTMFSSIQAISQSVAKAKQNHPEKPLVTCWLAEDIVADGLPVLRQANITNFSTPQRAATALAALFQRAQWLRSQ